MKLLSKPNKRLVQRWISRQFEDDNGAFPEKYTSSIDGTKSPSADSLRAYKRWRNSSTRWRHTLVWVEEHLTDDEIRRLEDHIKRELKAAEDD